MCDPRVDRLGAFAVPAHQGLKPAAAPGNLPLSRAGGLAHLARPNAEESAAWVAVDRLGIQACMGTAPWDHRPLLPGWVGPVAERLGEPAEGIVFDSSSFPQQGPPP